VVFAKSKPLETLFEHTGNVIKEVEDLRRCYGKKILEQSIPLMYKDHFWPALNLVCKVHDLGKIQTLFQNKILKACHMPEISVAPIYNLIEIPHNIISPAFLSKDLISPFPKELHPAIFQAVGLHHSRGTEYLESNEKWAIVKSVILTDVTSRIEEIDDVDKGLFNNHLADRLSYNYRTMIRDPFRPLRGDELDFCMMLKGCLHRADHSGSSHLPIEVLMNSNNGNTLSTF
jgi:CRISPR-associated endonuclease/helicase Cas3